LSAVLEQLLP